MKNSPKLKSILRFLQSAMFLTCIKSASELVTLKVNEESLMEFAYFTNIGLLYTIFCITCGIFKQKFPSFKKAHDFSLGTSVILSTMVTLNFWTIFYINPKLVKGNFTGEVNIKTILSEFIVHLFPMIILYIELYNNEVKKSKTHRIFLVSFVVIYNCILEILNYRNKSFIYGFLNHMNFKERLGFASITACLCLGLYEIVVSREWKKIKDE